MAYTFKNGDRPLEGYTIQRGVGRGGFGEVYYALSDGGKEVALKHLRDNHAVELRGVAQCLNLKSPHLVSIFDVKQNVEGEHFLVMEYVSGPSLRELLIESPKGLGVQKALYFLREIGQGLAYLHDRGIVHRDLKPGNILCDEGRVKIGDYGLSKFITVSRHSAQTSSVGTVHYMAPEVGSGSYSRGVDIYALGVILYEMLLGKVPFDGSSMGEVVIKHLTAQPEVDELPAPFPRVIRKALAKDPKDRYATVQEMMAEVFNEPDFERSLAGFEPMSLTRAAGRFAAAAGVAVPTGGSSGGRGLGVESLLTPFAPTLAAEAPESGEPDEAARASLARRRSWAVKLLALGALLLAFAPVSVVVEAIDGRIGGTDVAILVVCGALALQAFAVGAWLYRRPSPKGERLALPLQHSFVTTRRGNLDELMTRYLSLLGYKVGEREPMIWRFKRGSKSGEWTDDIRKCKTRLTIAGFEADGGLRLNCSLEMDGSWGCWVTQREMRVLAGELRGLEGVLGEAPESKVESRPLSPELDAVIERGVERWVASVIKD